MTDAAKTTQAQTAAEVAKAFADALKAGNPAGAEAFWSDDVVSLENMDGPMRERRGIEALRAKSDWWYGAHEVHSFACEGPFMHGDQFALLFKIDVTRKADNERIVMDEIGLYTVRDGKVVEERFFY